MKGLLSFFTGNGGLAVLIAGGFATMFAVSEWRDAKIDRLNERMEEREAKIDELRGDMADLQRDTTAALEAAAGERESLLRAIRTREQLLDEARALDDALLGAISNERENHEGPCPWSGDGRVPDSILRDLP